MPDQRHNPLTRYASDFLAFAADLHVPLGASTGRLGSHWAPFQKLDFEALAPGLHCLARGEVAPIRRFWIERTKGGSKDSDCAVAILWLLAFAGRSLRIQVGAADQQQAAEVRDIIRSILNIDSPLNRVLARVVEVQKFAVVSHASTPGRPESQVEILTSDAYSSHGARPDVVIANELSHVGSEAFMQTLLDNADKLPHSLVVVATNAGEVGSWQEKWRDIARESPRWHVSVLNQPAPWVSETDLAESRLRNPPHRFARLWQGVWSSGEGDALNPADIAACTTLVGPSSPRQDRIYLAGLDLGVKRDHSALCIVSADQQTGRVELVNCVSWRPQDFADGVVDLEVVRETVEHANRLYNFRCVGYDPWQAHLLAQELVRAGVPMREWVFNSGNKDFMARSLLEAFANRTIALYREPQLERDLMRLRIKEGPLGFRLDAVKDADGHADRAIALAIVLPAALYLAREFYEPRAEPEIVFA